ncbi:MAG: hypothetical protein EZS28_021700 [Streblomastix strix]|uniref:Uncharacterized protein n=1 Tax=Streblomastix strix TaxID=222440 RepID=A0A5J4VKN8_9EUKA|nr:MAG: hypothetical protein EZS28_021700 [Streblomastix strix]
MVLSKYSGGKMYIAGRVTGHIKIHEANDQDYRDTKRKDMMKIINSEDCGSTIEGNKQQNKYAIKDQDFWDQHYKEWLPWECCTIAEEKKLFGCAIESQRESIICLAPKCYTAIDGEVGDIIRMKDINEKNSGLTRDDYINCIENNSNVSVPITQIQLKNGVMLMIKIKMSALRGVIDKMIAINSDISKGQSYPCASQMVNVDASSFLYI